MRKHYRVNAKALFQSVAGFIRTIKMISTHGIFRKTHTPVALMRWTQQIRWINDDTNSLFETVIIFVQISLIQRESFTTRSRSTTNGVDSIQHKLKTQLSDLCIIKCLHSKLLRHYVWAKGNRLYFLTHPFDVRSHAVFWTKIKQSRYVIDWLNWTHLRIISMII